MDFSKLGQAAAESDDQSVEKASARPVPRAGVALMRLREYIELGRHAPKNPTHKPALKTMLVFELLHPDHMIDTDDGKVPMTLTVRVNKTASSKGRFLPLFQKMNHDGKAHHMVQMIGKPFLGTLTHNQSEDKKTTYVNLDGADGKWNIGAPQQVDALTNMTTEIPVPELKGKGRAFLWENASITEEQYVELWNSLHIEGVRTDDNGKEHSKNWIQETIQKGMDWEGSVIQGLTETSVDVSELTAPEQDSAADVPTY